MTWFLIKGLLLLFAFFILTGTIGNLFGWLFFKLSKSLNNDWLLVASTIFLIIFSILCFSFIGLFYASFTFALTTYMKLWLAIIIVSVFVISIYIHTVKEYLKLKNKLQSEDFNFNPRNSEYHIRNHVNTKTILSSGYFIVLSYIFFLIFQNLADKFSFGLTTSILSLIK
jgi:hypothetical protein